MAPYRRIEHFVTSMFAVDGEPTSEAHAKRMGTRFTVCGLECANWPKFWTMTFPPANARSVCLECTSLVRDSAIAPEEVTASP